MFRAIYRSKGVGPHEETAAGQQHGGHEPLDIHVGGTSRQHQKLRPLGRQLAEHVADAPMVDGREAKADRHNGDDHHDVLDGTGPGGASNTAGEHKNGDAGKGDEHSRGAVNSAIGGGFYNNPQPG